MPPHPTSDTHGQILLPPPPDPATCYFSPFNRSSISLTHSLTDSFFCLTQRLSSFALSSLSLSLCLSLSLSLSLSHFLPLFHFTPKFSLAGASPMIRSPSPTPTSHRAGVSGGRGGGTGAAGAGRRVRGAPVGVLLAAAVGGTPPLGSVGPTHQPGASRAPAHGSESAGSWQVPSAVRPRSA